MTCPYRVDHQCAATPVDGGVWDCDVDCEYIEELLMTREVLWQALGVTLKDDFGTADVLLAIQERDLEFFKKYIKEK